VTEPSPDDVLRVFDAFLTFARGGATPAPSMSPAAPPAASREVAPTIAPSSALLASMGAPPPSVAPAAPVVRGARVTGQTPPRAPGSNRSEEATRVSPLSEAMASSLAPLSMHSSPWEEPTRERPDVVREMLSSEQNLSDTQQSLPVFEVQPAPRMVEEQSIIVEDEGLTNPEFGREDFSGAEVRAASGGFAAHGPMPVEQFVQEMSVLIKYGHAGQAARETEHWIAAHPDDLTAHLKIAEFEMARLDRDAAVNRFVSLVARLLERGDQAGAADVVQKLRRDAPDDLRVSALSQRYGR
jgi:hypothetical protein